MSFRFLILLVQAVCFVSCAAVYKPINPERLPYSNYYEDNGLGFSYRYNVLEETGNKRYAKKQFRKGVQIVAVRIKNTSKSDVQIGATANFYVNDIKVLPLDPEVVKKELKQSPYVYLCYLALVPVPVSVSFQPQSRAPRRGLTDIPVGYYLIGPGISAANIFVALKSNKKLLINLKQYDITNKVLKPGDEVYGLIGLPYNAYDPLYLYRESN